VNCTQEKKKYLLVLEAVLKARTISLDHPHVHLQTVKFFHLVSPQLESLNPIVASVISGERDKILAGKSLQQLNQEFLKKFNSSNSHKLVATELMFLLSPKDKQEALKFLQNLELTKGRKQLKEAISIHQSILSVFEENQVASEFKKKCKTVFLDATYFMEKAEVEQRRKQREELEKEQIDEKKDENNNQKDNNQKDK